VRADERNDALAKCQGQREDQCKMSNLRNHGGQAPSVGLQSPGAPWSDAV
jgi:hypothetical protein